MGIRFDPSACTVLAICDQCAWLELTTTAAAARDRALEHVWQVHPHDLVTQKVIYRWRARNRVGASE